MAGSPLGAVKQTFAGFSDDQCGTMAAALAFYTAISLPPLLVLVVTVAGFIWSPEAVTGVLQEQISSVVGEGGWQQVETMMQRASDSGGGGMIATLLSIGGLIFGATGVMVQLQNALNAAWSVEPDPEQSGIKNFVVKRMLSLAMILGVAFLLLVSLVLTAALSAVGGLFTGMLPQDVAQWVPQLVNFVVSLVIFTLLFAAMLKWLPDAEIRWENVWVGAFATALLFMVGKFAIGYYLGAKDTGTYGAASSFVLILLWVYYSGMILLLGAEFTEAWSKYRGHSISPTEGAVRVVERKEHVRHGQQTPAHG